VRARNVDRDGSSIKSASVRLVGWPRPIARPGLPRIRTCPI